MNRIELPILSQEQRQPANGRVLLRDDGFRPQLEGNSISLGPEQMAVVGFGQYARQEYDMGVEDQVVIPESIEPITAVFHATGSHSVEGSVPAPDNGALRVVLQQRAPQGDIRRTWAGGPPKGENMAQVLKIEALQHGQPLPVRVNYDKVIWSGLSWGVAEVSKFTSGEPIEIRCSSSEKDPVKLDVKIYRVRYQ